MVALIFTSSIDHSVFHRWWIGFATIIAAAACGAGIAWWLLFRRERRATSDYQETSDDSIESENGMSQAFELAGAGLWEWEIATGRMRVSRNCRRLYDLSDSIEFTRVAFLGHIHPDDREATRQAVAGALAGKERYDVEYRWLLANGVMRWISERGRVDRDSMGRAVRVYGASIDVTERRIAEERFRLVVEGLPNAIIIVGDGGRIALVNKEAERIFGYARQELVGFPVETLIPGCLEAPHKMAGEVIRGAVGAGTPGLGRELLGRRKDGSVLQIELALSSLRMPDGDFALASVTDVTWRRYAQAEIAHQRNALAHFSRVNMLGELSGSLAHELNQPLTAILSNAQAAQRFLAAENFDREELRDILGDIVAEDRRAGEVIQRLRLLLRKGEVQQQALDINVVIQDVLKLMRSDLIDKNMDVNANLAGDLPFVSGDRVQLQQVMLNLVLNACDSMVGVVNGDRRLTLSTGLSNDFSVVVTVSDRGTGIAPESLERVFDPFFTTKSHGMGLGLAVCRTIITAHGGRLWATNNPDRGASFHMALPTKGSSGK